MPYEVIQPPTSDEKMAEVGKEILEAAVNLGRPMDIEGFLQAWVTGLRIVAERDDKGNITGLALVTVGHRWLFLDYAASVIWKKAKDDKAMIDYIKMFCTAMGVSDLYVETDTVLEETPSFKRHEIVQHILRK